MRKLVSILLVTLILFALVGCTRQQEIEQAAEERLDQMLEDSAEKVREQYAVKTPTPSPMPSTAVTISNEQSTDSFLIQELFEEYRQSAIDNYFEFSVVDNSLVLKGYHYEFLVENVTNNPTALKFDEGTSCTYSLSFMNAANMQSIKDFITATFMITGDMDLQAATKSMQELVNSYDEKTYSKVFKSGDYTLFLIPNAYSQTINTFRVVYTEDISGDINRSEYISVDYETALAPMNANTKIVVKGEIIETTYETITSGTNCIEFKDTDGNKYYALYYFTHMPVEPLNGQAYTFYGYLTAIEKDYPVIQLDFFENSDS
jgi:uncharacterized protein YcfL